MDDIRIGYFLEDIGHRQFLEALVTRVAQQMRIPSIRVHSDVRNATGGLGKALGELRGFLRDVLRERERPFDVLVIAIDGNCQGYQQKRNDIQEIVNRSDYRGAVACAVPDPHVERWYLADPGALRRILDLASIPAAPPYKCERARYKEALRTAIRQAGVVAPLGGVEYGAEIAEATDLFTAGKADAAFKHFVDELTQGLAHLATG